MREAGNWSEREDSNLRPPAPEAGALPGCATLRPWRRGYRVSRPLARGIGRCGSAVLMARPRPAQERRRGSPLRQGRGRVAPCPLLMGPPNAGLRRKYRKGRVEATRIEMRRHRNGRRSESQGAHRRRWRRCGGDAAPACRNCAGLARRIERWKPPCRDCSRSAKGTCPTRQLHLKREIPDHCRHLI